MTDTLKDEVIALTVDAVEKAYQMGLIAGAKAEREACAMECIKLAHKWTRLGAWGENNEFHDCAAAIRARGQA